MRNRLRSLKPEVYWRTAGVVCLGFELRGQAVAVHLLVEKAHRQWGKTESWWDGPLGAFGLGPCLLVTWMGVR